MRKFLPLFLLGALLLAFAPAAHATGTCWKDSPDVSVWADFMAEPDQAGNNVEAWITNNTWNTLELNCGFDLVSGDHPAQSLDKMVITIQPWNTVTVQDFFEPEFQACYDLHYGCFMVGPPGTTIEYCKDLDRACFCPNTNGARHANNDCPTPEPAATQTPTPTVTATPVPIPTATETEIPDEACAPDEHDPVTLKYFEGRDVVDVWGRIWNLGFDLERDQIEIVLKNTSSTLYAEIFYPFANKKRTCWNEKGIWHSFKACRVHFGQMLRFRIHDERWELAEFPPNLYARINIRKEGGDNFCFITSPLKWKIRKNVYHGS